MSRKSFLSGFLRSNATTSRQRPSSVGLKVESLERRELLTTLAVDIGDPGCDMDGDKLYCEIQEAVDAAEEGDKIKVREGIYEPISIVKDDLRIQAVGRGDVTIDVDAELNPDPGVVLNADGVTIKGLTVTGARGYGMLVTGDHNRLQNNIVDNTSAQGLGQGVIGHGIALEGADDNVLTGNTARDNARWGVDVSGSNSNTIVNNTVTENTNGIEVSDGSAFNMVQANTAMGNNNGIVLGPSQSNTLRGNVAEANNYRGFFLLFGANENVLEGNTARNNGRQGYLLVVFSESNILRGNIAEGNGTLGELANDQGFGLAIGSNNNTLQGNIARDNAGEGFEIAGSNSNTLQGNMAMRNGGAGFLVGDGSIGNTLKANTANGNSGDGFTSRRPT